MSDLLEQLNDEQKEAVMHAEGPLMIVAGAGTGKTTVITKRIAWLIEQDLAKPEEILALTFTEKAASEMEERVDALLPMGYLDLWVSTFHAFCERLLSSHALEIGLPHDYTLYTQVDISLLLRRRFQEFALDYYKPRGNPMRFTRALLTHFSRLKDEVISTDDYLRHASKMESRVSGESGVPGESDIVEHARVTELANAYAMYQNILLAEHALDFGDLISFTIELLRTRPNIRKQYQNQFKYILVDEFQDTNHAQYELVKLLVGDAQNITVVGDDDQSIYKFRGASLSNIFRFREDYPKATSIVLTKNYRSRQEILDAAYRLIQNNNPDRLEVKENLNKELAACTTEKGVVEHISCTNIDDEVQNVVERMVALQNDGSAWGDMALLVRANASAKPFLDLMDTVGIPYRYLAMTGLYTKPIILDALAWMHLLNQVHDSPSMYRILSHPHLGISHDGIAMLGLEAKKGTVSLYHVMRARVSGEKSENLGDDPGILPGDDNERIESILEGIETLQSHAKRLPVSELFVEIIKTSGILGDIRMLEEAAQAEYYDHLNQFFERLKRFENGNADKTLHHFLFELVHERESGELGALKVDADDGPDVVSVMTVHGSKGLEFRHVFLVSLIEQRFPSVRRADPIPIPDELLRDDPSSKEQHMQEERRLFYVALTRAKEGAYLYSSESYGGVRKRKPSRFIAEAIAEGTSGIKSDKSGKGMITGESEKMTSDLKPYELPKTVSFTQIAAFSTCPMQYKFAHILKVPVFGRHSMSFGKSMHSVLELYLGKVQEVEKVEEVKEAELLDLYDQCWIDEWYPDQITKDEYYEKGKESLIEYRKQLITDPPTIAFLEKGFTLKIGDITVRGRIDRMDQVDGGIEIVDYKTGKPKEKLSWQDKRQLVLYQLACEQCFDPPLIVKKLTYHYLDDNSTVSFEASVKDKVRLTAEFLDTVEAIKKSDFSATPGFHCSYCDFKGICEFKS
jgi:DNA helicase II / ATP-dependent DNA helicase PcrA